LIGNHHEIDSRQLNYYSLFSSSPRVAASVRPMWQLGFAMIGVADTSVDDRKEYEEKTRTHFTCNARACSKESLEMEQLCNMPKQYGNIQHVLKYVATQGELYVHVNLQ
jgi:hypothetical protein